MSPRGNWVKCGARTPKPSQRFATGDSYYTCYKKAGHHITGSKDNRKHVDNKQAPAHYWVGPSCGASVAEGPCANPPDPMDPRHAYGEEYYCDEHWDVVYEERTALARKGIY